MAHREDNIFYNVIRNETSLTEVFCNFMKYKQFREIFLNLVAEKNEVFKKLKSHIKFDNFETEKVLDDNLGRADLVLETNEDTYIFELKVEIYTQLTNNQPVNYLKFLDNKNENLFFILPKGYIHLSEICTKWNNENTDYSTKTINEKNILYWEDILVAIRKNELDKLNPFISEFCDILDYRWFRYEKITFTTQELELIFSNKKDKGYKMLEERSMPKTISKLFEIVDGVYSKLENKINKKFDEQRSEFYGHFIKSKQGETSNDLNIFFGVDFEVWENKGYPITIQIFSDSENEDDTIELDKQIENLFPEFTKYFNEDGELILFYYGLEKKIFESKDENIIKTLQDKVLEVVDTLSKSK